MNLGVETYQPTPGRRRNCPVSAFSDESWGGDRLLTFLDSPAVERFSIL